MIGYTLIEDAQLIYDLDQLMRRSTQESQLVDSYGKADLKPSKCGPIDHWVSYNLIRKIDGNIIVNGLDYIRIVVNIAREGLKNNSNYTWMELSSDWYLVQDTVEAHD